MGLLRNGIHGYRVAGNATLLGSRSFSRNNFATNVLTWTGGANEARERVSYPSGLSRSAFHMALKDGGMRVTVTGGATIISSIEGPANMTVVLTGGGGIVPPTLFAARSMNVLLTGGGSITTAQIGAIANMRCVIRIGASPSAFDIAQAVWLQNPEGVNLPNTMGKQAKDTKNETGLIPGAL
jgi:hypothetical protein